MAGPSHQIPSSSLATLQTRLQQQVSISTSQLLTALSAPNICCPAMHPLTHPDSQQNKRHVMDVRIPVTGGAEAADSLLSISRSFSVDLAPEGYHSGARARLSAPESNGLRR